MKPLSAVESAEMERFFGGLKNRTNPLAPGRTIDMDAAGALEHMMAGRPPALRHVWDVRLGQHFLADCGAAPADVRECAVSNVAVMAAATLPGSMGIDTGSYSLWACEIGRRYRIVYEFMPRWHSIVLYFLRRHEAAYGGPLRVVLPRPDHAEPGYVESYGEIVARSYDMDMEKEDLRDIINRLCAGKAGRRPDAEGFT